MLVSDHAEIGKTQHERDTAVISCLPSAQQIAGRIAHQMGRRDIEPDLVNEAMLSAMSSFESFDPDRGVSFKAYAFRGMKRSARLHALRITTPVKFPSRDLKEHHSLGQRSGEVQVRAAMNVVSLSEPEGVSEVESSLSLAPSSSRVGARDVSAVIARLRSQMDGLDVKERETIDAYFGLEGKPQHSVRDLAAEYNESHQAIYKRVGRCLDQLSCRILQDPVLEESIRDTFSISEHQNDEPRPDI